MLLRSLFQTRFEILHCYRMSNNPPIKIKVSLSLSLNISIYEIARTQSCCNVRKPFDNWLCDFNEHKIFNHFVSYGISVQTLMLSY